MLISNYEPLQEDMPQPLKQLHELLKQSYGEEKPTSFVTIDKPLDSDGPWRMEFNSKPGRVIVQWSHDRGFLIMAYELPGLHLSKSVDKVQASHMPTSPQNAFESIQRIIATNTKRPKKDSQNK